MRQSAKKNRPKNIIKKSINNSTVEQVNDDCENEENGDINYESDKENNTAEGI